jgi:hypothetical protein
MSPVDVLSANNINTHCPLTGMDTNYLSLYGSAALVDLGRFFSFLIYTQSVGLLGRGNSTSEGCYLHIGRHKHRINAQTSMPQVGFEPTLRVFERAQTVYALDGAATVIGYANYFRQLN